MKDESDLLDNIDKLEINERIRLIDKIGIKNVIDYINENGQKKNEIMELFFVIQSNDVLEKVFEIMNNDLDKTKTLLFSHVNDREKYRLLSKIKTPYYRNLIVKQISEYNFETENLIKSINNYTENQIELDKLQSEEEKAKYISALNNDDMKLAFLEQIKTRENRNLIIDSFENEVDPRIKGQVEIVQKMIKEYMEDTLKEKFDESKREKLEIIFKKASVSFGELENNINGEADFLFDDIVIAEKHSHHSANHVLGFLVHEYEHLLSNYDYKFTKSSQNHTFEEGMADTFADVVINHYLDKHKEIEIEGKKVRIDKPYQAFSGYDFQNAYMRTVLYGLSKSGKDKEAIGEYVLGDKRKFCELAFGKEKLNNMRTDNFGNPDIVTSKSELYNLEQLDFSKINFNSIYAKRNFILPLYELQNRLNVKEKNVIAQIQTASEIGNDYFDNRKLYEISREEMEKFHNLLIAQADPRDKFSDEENTNIINSYEFYLNKVQELSKEELKDNSFEVLDVLLGMKSYLKIDLPALNNLIEITTLKERENVENGQTIAETMKKYKRIIPEYLKLANPQHGESYMYIYDNIEDLKFSYLEQIRGLIEKGKEAEVIEALKDKENGEIYLDSDIKGVFEEYNIGIENQNSKKIFPEKEVCKNVIFSVSTELMDEAQEQVNRDTKNIEIEKNNAINIEK